jgi:hypothetical protein
MEGVERKTAIANDRGVVFAFICLVVINIG